MKQAIILGLIIVSAILPLKAQIYTPSGTIQGTTNNTFVGIGTANPLFKLNVEGNHGDSRILLHSTGGGTDIYQADLMLWASEPGWTYSGVGIGNNVKNQYNASNGLAINRINTARGGSYLRFLDNSMVFNLVSSAGVDKQVLYVDANGLFTVSASASINSNLNIGKQEAPSNTAGEIVRMSIQPFGHTGGPWNFKARDIPGVAFLDVMYGSGNAMTFNSNLNVGIGTTNPDQKLTVKGKIHAEEIIVDLRVPADYVFQKYYTGKSELKSDYVMPTLADIESFTKKNNHLPNVPSAEEIQQNGLLLGTMSNILLQKVEELTLYVIEQNKELKIQKTQLQLQNDKIILLENKIESNELCPLKN
jgi:hypothetical protein